MRPGMRSGSRDPLSLARRPGFAKIQILLVMNPGFVGISPPLPPRDET